jgi:hypothetical protein
VALIWNIISGKNLLLNEISRITVLLPIERAEVTSGSEEAQRLFSFSLAVDTFVKALTIESKHKAFAATAKKVQSEPGPIERLASFAAWLFEKRIVLTGSRIAAIISKHRKAMYPVGSTVNAAIEFYGDAEDRYIAIRQSGHDDGGVFSRSLMYAIYDVLGISRPKGFTVDDILAECPKYDPARWFEFEIYVKGLIVNLTDLLLENA